MGRARSSPQLLPLSLILFLACTLAAGPALAQPRPGHIRGAVFAMNAPLAGARVEAFPSMITGDSTSPVIETVTDQHGRYDLAVPHPGCYGVRASAPGYVPQMYGERDPWTNPCVEVPSGGAASGIDFHLAPAGSIGGRVTDERTGAPVVSSLVVAWPVGVDSLPPPDDPRGDGSDPGGRWGPGSTVTDENGDYVLDGLAAGSYIVMAQGEGYLPEFFDGAARFEEATPVPVVAGQVTSGVDFTLGRGGCIAGLVTSAESGQPIEGAQVWVFPSVWTDPPGGEPRRERRERHGDGVTGPDGRYILCGLPPGEYVVQAWADGFLPEFYDDAARLEDADPVSVPSEGETAGIDFTLSRGGSIEGLVTERDTGAPMPGAWVMAWPVWSDSTVPGDPSGVAVSGGAATADSSGRYVIAGLESGRYLVVAEAPGFLPTFHGGGTDPSQAVPVEVTAPAVTAGIDIGLVRGGSIAGAVRDAATAEPIAHAWVELYLPYMGGYGDVTNTRPFPGPGAITDENGEYRIDGIPTGSYILFCSAWDQGYEPEFYKDARSPERATPVGVTAPDEVGGIDFTLSRHGPPRGEIAGRVSRAAGDPVPGAVVLAVSLAGQAGFATTGTDGFYTIRGLGAGAYYVFAAATGLVGEFYDDALGWEQATPVDVAAAVGGIDFVLAEQSSGPGAIEGRVTDGGGRGVAQAWVYADPIGSGARGFSTTGADGRYSLAGLAPGVYHVRATRVGFESRYYGGPTASDAAVVNVPAGAVRGVDIVLPVTVEEGGVAVLRVIGNVPNPFRRSTAIEFRFDRAGEDVTVDIFDIRGRHVRRLERRTESAGLQRLGWDGLDATGRAAAAGFYVYRVSAAGRSAAGRMLLVE